MTYMNYNKALTLQVIKVVSVLLFGPSEHPLAPLRPGERARRQLADQSLLTVAHILLGDFKINCDATFALEVLRFRIRLRNWIFILIWNLMHFFWNHRLHTFNRIQMTITHCVLN